MTNLLSIKSVLKQYRDHTAVDRVSFDVRKGALFGMLGPNGAGKTSLIRIITGITAADEGEVLFDGRPWQRSDIQKIGYMPEERGLYKKMKVADHLEYLAQLRGMSKDAAKKEIKIWFDKFEIASWWNKKIEELSKGMQQKIQFIATVIHQPSLLILDEPFSGLDPINANLLKDEIYRLNKEGTTIIFSTHRMEQVEEICDHIVLVNKGKILLNGNVGEIKETFKKHLYSFQIENGEWSNPPGSEVIKHSGSDYVVRLSSNVKTNEVLQHLIQHNVTVKSFHEILPSLNEVFIERVGRS